MTREPFRVRDVPRMIVGAVPIALLGVGVTVAMVGIDIVIGSCRLAKKSARVLRRGKA